MNIKQNTSSLSKLNMLFIYYSFNIFLKLGLLLQYPLGERLVFFCSFYILFGIKVRLDSWYKLIVLPNLSIFWKIFYKIDCNSFLNNWYNSSVKHLENLEVMCSIFQIIYNTQEFLLLVSYVVSCIFLGSLPFNLKFLNILAYFYYFILLFFGNTCRTCCNTLFLLDVDIHYLGLFSYLIRRSY